MRSQRKLNVELWRVPFLGGTPKRIIDNIGGLVAWSPDGRRMAFAQGSVEVSTLNGPTTALITADPDGSHERVLASRQRPPDFNVIPVNTMQQPAWSPRVPRLR